MGSSDMRPADQLLPDIGVMIAGPGGSGSAAIGLREALVKDAEERVERIFSVEVDEDLSGGSL
jgi:hypothetical protein